MRTLVTISLLIVSGCTHHQLRWNTVNQAQTLTDIYERQVLDNLAMFNENPHSVPHFAIPKSGGTDVTDKGSFTASPLNELRKKIGLSADRTMKESWTLDPVTDTDKLRRIRCAFQRAVGCPDENCVKCCAVRKEFLGKSDKRIALFEEDGSVAVDPKTGRPYENTVRRVLKQEVDKDTLISTNRDVFVFEPLRDPTQELSPDFQAVLRQLVDEEGRPVFKNGKPVVAYVAEERFGRRSEVRVEQFDCYGECEIHQCPRWYEVTRRRSFPNHWKQYVGRHGKTTVWVPPSGRDELGRLVLEVMDYALKDPPVKPKKTTKEVTLYLDAFGKPSDRKNAFQVIRTEIPIDKDNIAAEKGRIVKKDLSRLTLEQKLLKFGIKPSDLSNLTEVDANVKSFIDGLHSDSRKLLLDDIPNASKKSAGDLLDLLERRANSQIEALEAEAEAENQRAAARAANEIIQETPAVEQRQPPTIDLRELELNRQFILGD